MDDDLIKIIFGTNMFLVMVFSISAVMKHHRNNKIEWRTLWIMGPLAIVGSFIGSWGASIAEPAVLKKAFEALQHIKTPGEIVDIPFQWKRETY